MKKRTIYVLSVLLLSVNSFTCTQNNVENNVDEKHNFDKEEVRKKVGQLFLLAFSGKDKDVVIPFIKGRGIGGLYLSNDNIEDPRESAILVKELHKASVEGISGLPLLTGADQEGAWAVIAPKSSIGPGNMALGCAGPEHTKNVYSVFAKEISSIGVFCDLAPCADVNSNPINPIIGIRSFGENAVDVAANVKAAIEGLHSQNVIATVKHFPGHGNTSTDSHLGIPVVNRSLEDIKKIDLLPFETAVKAGVDVVMTAHILYTALDEIYPATFSKKILIDYLRKELGYKGMVISDSFNMLAIQNGLKLGDKTYNPLQAAVASINAGVDMIMLAEERYGQNVGDYIKSQTKLLDYVENAVLNGEISMERLNEAYNRIVNLKKKYKLAERIDIDVEKAVAEVGCEENRLVCLNAARASINLVYDNKKLIPLKSGSKVTVIQLAKENVNEIMKVSAGIGPNYSDGYNEFVRTLKKQNFIVEEYKEDSKPNGTIIIAVSENYPLPGFSLDMDYQHKKLEGLKKHNLPIINVALKDPYDARMVNPDAYVSCLGANRSNAQAVVDLLSGKIKSSKKLSVTPIQKK